MQFFDFIRIGNKGDCFKNDQRKMYQFLLSILPKCISFYFEAWLLF